MATTVWKLSSRSQEFQDGPRLRQEGDRLIVAYDFELDDGQYAWEEFYFLGVLAFCFTDWRACSAEQVAAYDQVQVLDECRFGDIGEDQQSTRLYRIFFDDYGCIEVCASAFLPPPS